MLGKLLKYELKATSRQFLPLFGVLFVLAVLNRVFTLGNMSGLALPAVITVAVYFALIVAIFVLTFIVMIQRFNKNLLSDEGYLMFTLPVRTSDLVISKLITSLIWLSASMAVLFLSLFIISSGSSTIMSISNAWNQLFAGITAYVGGSAWLLMLELLVSAILDLCCSIMIIYAAISIGHLFGGRRIIASFGAFLLLSLAYSSLEIGILGGLGLLNFAITLGNFLGGSGSVSGSPLLIHGITLINIALAAVFALFCYAITNHILSKRLNLE